MATYFISDLHIDPSRPTITEAFYYFVETTAANADALYIVGDFFDAWIGDDEDNPFHASIKAKLRSYTDSGLKIYFTHGNRDFLIGKDFASETGIEILNELEVIELYGLQALLMHGDSLCTKDIEYMHFRKQVRDPAWQQQILSLPLAHRRQIAQDMRTKSQSMNSNKAEDIMDVTPSEVTKLMDEHQVSTLIHGHTHRPAHHRFEHGELQAERIVLGDWEEKGWYIKADSTGIELVDFVI